MYTSLLETAQTRSQDAIGLEASEKERDEMNRAGRRLARDEYDWSTVARSMQSVYEWMLGGNRPACVVE